MLKRLSVINGYQWITKNDFDAYLGLLFDGFSKVLASVGILLFGFGMPANIVIGRILPGLAIATLFGNLWYAYEAYRLAKKENRQDTTAQPYGVGAGQVFGWLFLIIGPVYWKTNDPILAWQVGLAACFIGGVVEIAGSFMGKYLVKIISRAALLGNLAAGAVIWLSLVGMLNIYDKPFIAIIPFIIIVIAYIGKVKMPFGLSAGILAVLIGTVIAWISGQVTMVAINDSLASIKLQLPKFSGFDMIKGFKSIKDFLPIIIPLQIANFITTLQGLESANVAGDKYPVKMSMTMDGVGTIIGSLFGNPFPTTVYYGHPSWKEVGARAGYSVLNGFTYLIIGVSGAFGLLSAIIPFQAVMPILVFVGFSMAAQAFNESPKKHAAAIIFAFIPIIAQYIETGVNAALTAVGTNLDQVGIKAFEAASFPIKGMLALSQGAFLSSLLLAAFMVCIIDKKFNMASIFAFSLAVFSSIGLIHSASVELFPQSALAFVIVYAIIGIICLGFNYLIVRSST